jgi:dephospho-CoA kinase
MAKIKVIALTGNIGSGKSFVLKVCRLLKLETIELDQVARLVTNQLTIQAKLRALFPWAWQGDQLDRKALAQHTFNDPTALQALEQVLHPAIKAQLQAELKHLDQAGKSLVVVEIPLLFEVGWQDIVDVIVLCDAPVTLRAARALQRPAMTTELFEKIDKSQHAHALKAAQAHYRIDTGVTKPGTVRRIGQLLQECTVAKE